MAIDPVCNMEVEEGKFCSTYEGKKYCFCSEMCKEKFEEGPSRFIEGSEKETK